MLSSSGRRAMRNLSNRFRKRRKEKESCKDRPQCVSKISVVELDWRKRALVDY